MVYSIHRWVTHLLRPKLTQVNIRVLFDGKEVNACSLSDIQLIALSKSIEELCKVNKHSLYWFEVECYEKSSCTKKPDSSLYLICYTEDKTKSSFKRKIDILCSQLEFAAGNIENNLVGTFITENTYPTEGTLEVGLIHC